MVRTYKKKTNRGEWNPESMKNAIDAVMRGEMGYKRAADSFQVPQSTLERRVKQTREQGDKTDDMPRDSTGRRAWDPDKMREAVQVVREKKMGLKKAAKKFQVPKTTLRRLAYDVDVEPQEVVLKKLGRPPVLPAHIEKDLVEYLLLVESKFYGFTRMDVRRMAYQLAQRNNIPNPFKNECAGSAWLDHFLKRFKDNISLRKPIGTSYARAAGFTKERVAAFFNVLEEEYLKKQYSPCQIWNVDETGLSIVQSKVPQVIGLKGKRQICSLTAAERGSLVTIVCAMSAGGSFIPPMVIFPRTNMTESLMRGAPPGTLGKAHPSGWIQMDLFTEWFKHFIAHAKPTETSPALLILDGHYSHTRNVEVLDLARQNHVSIVCLPSHTSHKLQPLDRTFIAPLKAYYSENVRRWMLTKDRIPGPYDLCEMFGEAYLRSCNANIAVDGFRVTGIWPLDKNIFSDADFIAGEHVNSEVSSPPSSSISAAIPVAPYVSPQDIQPVPEKKKKCFPL